MAAVACGLGAPTQDPFAIAGRSSTGRVTLPCGCGLADCLRGESAAGGGAGSGSGSTCGGAFTTWERASSTSGAATASSASGAEEVTRELANSEVPAEAARINMAKFVCAVAFAVLALGSLLLRVGVRSKGPCVCHAESGYGACAMFKDLRSIGSFAMGALFCCWLNQGKDANIVQVAMADKLHLYAFMF
mmetsp:Transcript_48962/g.140715  ORF Transcript_48962/g.140715 Transcript_48962/m.140715 type:complete len:190 (-) Transcript_48962:115-684(-)